MLSSSRTLKISGKAKISPCMGTLQNEEQLFSFRVRQLLARVHIGHLPMLMLPPCALLNVPMNELVDLVSLNVITNILAIAT
jgi:hypothetical protein